MPKRIYRILRQYTYNKSVFFKLLNDSTLSLLILLKNLFILIPPSIFTITINYIPNKIINKINS